MSKRDYYEVLGIERSVGEAEIKGAYRRLALKFHPDRNPGDTRAEEQFKEAAEAYAVLADADKRRMYDRFGHAGVGAGAAGGVDPTIFSDFGDILGGLGDIFGFGEAFGGGRRRGGPVRGSDLRYDLEITFDEAAHGSETTVQIPRDETCEPCGGSGAAPGSSPSTCSRCQGRGQVRYQQGFLIVARTCDQCRGSGKTIGTPCPACRGAGHVTNERKLTVKIPAGIATGQRLRLPGEGEHGAAGGPPGDLYVVVHVHDHPTFIRDGDDLHCDMTVNFPTLALGGEITVPTLDGEETLKIPAGTQPSVRLRLRDLGMPNVAGRGRGDLYVRVQVAVPRDLTAEQRELLEQLRADLPPASVAGRDREEGEHHRPFFDRVKDIFG